MTSQLFYFHRIPYQRLYNNYRQPIFSLVGIGQFNNHLCSILSGFFQEFLLFPNLSMLYLHQNEIEDFVEVYKLRELNKLRTLTLNNNPMCTNPKYRSNIVQLLPKIRKLDNVVVLRSERESKSLSICKDIQVRLRKSYPDDFNSSGVLKTDL